MHRTEMNTPICDFAAAYAKKKPLRLHMPGHKGAEPLDITEIEGADVLYSAKGIIAESEENARMLFDSGKTLYSAEGSSLSIRAMLYLASLWGQAEGRDRCVLAGRNAHRVFHSAAALLDLEVKWLYGDSDSLISCNITPERLEKALTECEKNPFAVYLTSPDYLGNTLDIRELSAVCERYDILCLVDNAHGAYLRFLFPSQHPINLGAHMCADSAHKTLPALTGAAYLHISKTAPKMLSIQAENAMSLFASTSPSYLILQSLDRLNKYLSEGYKEKLSAFVKATDTLKNSLAEAGYELIGDEPLKLTLSTKPYGYLGEEIAERLRTSGIICEHADKDTVVLMLTPELSTEDIERLKKALRDIPKRTPIGETPPALSEAERVISIREATLCIKEKISAKASLGKILADSAVSCPPAVPIAVCGERIGTAAVELFKYYGIEEIWVVSK